MSIPYNDPAILRGMAEQHKIRGARLDAGDQRLGWKLGFGAPTSLQSLNLDAPLVGFLTGASLLDDGGSESIAGWTRPVAEPEIAVTMGADLPGDASREAAMAAVASLRPAIELADVNFPPSDIKAVLKGNIYHRRVTFGPADASRAGCRMDGLVGKIVHNDQPEVIVTDVQALTGEMVGLVRHVARVLAASGETLRAGDVIITGSIIPPIGLTPGDRVRFTLAPMEAISVTIDG